MGEWGPHDVAREQSHCVFAEEDVLWAWSQEKKRVCGFKERVMKGHLQEEFHYASAGTVHEIEG